MLRVNFKRSKKKGNAFVGVLVSIFILMLVVLLLATQIMPLIVYFELRQAGRSALLNMETQGGINQEIRDGIKTSISFNEYDASYLTITPGANVTPSTIPTYGSTISIDLDYKYHYSTYSLDGFNVVKGTAIRDIGIHLSTTSKKAQ